MIMFKQPLILSLSPSPYKKNYQEWENLVNIDKEDSDTMAVLLGDVANEELLYTLLGKMKDHWKYYFRYEIYEHYAFAWSFDGHIFVSDNPYFEVLMRIFRKICIAHKHHDEIDTDIIVGWRVMLESSLNALSYEKNSSVCTFDDLDHIYHFQNVFSNPEWVSSEYFTALFATLRVEDTKRQLEGIVETELLVDNSQQQDSQFVYFHLLARKLQRFIEQVCLSPTNPLCSRTAYVEYMQDVVSVTLPILKLVMAILYWPKESSLSLTGTFNQMDISQLSSLQPSVLRKMKSKMEISVSRLMDDSFLMEGAHLHENNLKNDKKTYTVFTGTDDNNVSSLLGHIEETVALTLYKSVSGDMVRSHSLERIVRDTSTRDTINVVMTHDRAEELRSHFQTTSSCCCCCCGYYFF